ncbi:MAG: prepilin-type N-terminal cleavage/methylation domain-containing protein [Acidobacteriota bacterium]|nr:prepilin-type N-terminal cleavage/methylation domain-containing protein [Acidobacteriota bacterium]
MTRRRSRQAGITLIEILIAVSLLSLLTVGMMMAMRIGFNTMEKTDAHLVTNRRVSNARKIIENEIAGFIFTRADFRPQPEIVQAVPFVQWEAHSMRFVTAYSLQDAWRGRPQIAAFQVIPGDRGQGVRLIVNETPWTGGAQTGQTILAADATGVHFTPIVPGTASFVLADRLAYCRFTYLEPRLEPPLRVWRPDWERPSLPLGIRIDMAPLDAGPSQLHVTTITTALSVNRDPGVYYADVP